MRRTSPGPPRAARRPAAADARYRRAMDLETWRAPAGESIPNHPRFAVLIYRGVPEASSPEAARALLGRHGWGGSWVDGVFDFHHFHSNAHEVLAVVAG